MMSNNRLRTFLLAASLLLLPASAASAQPDETDYFPAATEAQPFAPADLSTYGSGPRRNEGWFASWDGLLWTISAPTITSIGDPFPLRDINTMAPIAVFNSRGGGPKVQTNALNTGFITPDLESGNRVEFGFIRQNRGWLVSAFQLQNHNHSVEAARGGGVRFAPTFGPNNLYVLEGFVDNVGIPGPPPMPDGIDDDLNGDGTFGRFGPGAINAADTRYMEVFFDELQASNRVETQGVELMRLWRREDTGPRCGSWEFFGGLRYFRFNEEFHVFGAEFLDPLVGIDASLGGTGGVLLGDSFWNTESDNDIAGGQIGIRWSKRVHRLGWSVEGRAFAGANFQRTHQIGAVAQGAVSGDVNRPDSLSPNSFEYRLNATEFSPLVELRAQFHYQVTQTIFVRAGWTGMWMDGIARPSNMVQYKLQGTNNFRFGNDIGAMGILPNTQDVFVHGLTFGIEINR